MESGRDGRHVCVYAVDAQKDVVKWWIRINFEFRFVIVVFRAFVTHSSACARGSTKCQMPQLPVVVCATHQRMIFINYVRNEAENRFHRVARRSSRESVHSRFSSKYIWVTYMNRTHTHTTRHSMHMRVSFISYPLTATATTKTWKHNGFLLYIKFGAIESEIEIEIDRMPFEWERKKRNRSKWMKNYE